MTEEKTASTSNEDGKMAEEIPSNEDGVIQGRFEFGEARLKYGLFQATNDD
jgi:hypothetical protein